MKSSFVTSALGWVFLTAFTLAPLRAQATPTPPVVSLTATTPATIEPAPFIRVIPGQITLSRDGDTTEPLRVYLAPFSGTATYNLDYESSPLIDGSVVIPAGTNKLEISIHALQDAEVEGDESVELRFAYPPFAFPPPYTVDPLHNSATVIIHENDTAAAAHLEINQPHPGDFFSLLTPIKITATAIDPFGYISRVEFFDGENKIGVSEVNFIQAPDPGTPIEHTFIWTNPPAGPHSLTARALDSKGRHVISTPIPITVGPTPNPIVRIVATDPVATELPPTVDAIDPAVFTISREGDTNNPLNLFVSVHGTAKNGVDYQGVLNPSNSAPALVTIPAGQLSITITIIPIPDPLTYVEPMETVALKLEDSPLVGPQPTYQIDPQYRAAVAVIYEGRPPEHGALELALPDSGAQFHPGQSIDILAAGVNSTYGVHHVDFFADEHQIGSSEDNLKLLKQVYPHAFTWTNPPAGTHILQARATLPDGSVLLSSKISIIVQGEEPLPIVSIHYVPDLTLRPIPDADYAPGWVEVDRTGDTNTSLVVFYTVTGTATPGVDYDRLPGSIQIPPGEKSALISVHAFDDTLPEPNETVEFHLIHYPTVVPGDFFIPDYQIDPNNAEATITIYDNDSTVPPPIVKITFPSDGSVFALGQLIAIRAEVNNTTTLELRADGNLLASGLGPVLTFVWRDAPAGPHTLTATVPHAESPAVRILVQPPVSHSFVSRILPPAYLPGRPFHVTLIASPSSATRAYAVEDIPPTNWVVSGISNDGIFDQFTGKVKFGPFYDSSSRVLGYNLLPPLTAVGQKEFHGHASADGTLYPIAGDVVMTTGSEFHPADTNSDKSISLAELTAYAAIWKHGRVVIYPPSPVPMSYVTSAAMLWRTGEAYIFDPSKGSPPFCWIPAHPAGIAAQSLEIGSAERTGSNPLPGSDSIIQIAVKPPAGTISYAVTEKIPAGWLVKNISNDGEFDTNQNVIRWGLFLDANPRTLTYTLTPPPNLISIARLDGSVSFDGQLQPITGTSDLTATDNNTSIQVKNFEHSPDGTLNLTLSGPPGQIIELEVSSDLLTWAHLQTLFLPDGSISVTDTPPDPNTQRFYRLEVQ